MVPLTSSLAKLNWPGWFRLSLMDRYIFQELALPFLFGVGAFSSIGVSVGALFDLIRQVTESGLTIGLAMQVFVLKMPEFIVLAFPGFSQEKLKFIEADSLFGWTSKGILHTNFACFLIDFAKS